MYYRLIYLNKATMITYQLGDFTSQFLKFQGLEDFSLAFEPKRRGSRRAKRSSASIKAKNPTDGSALRNSKTVADLIKKFQLLAPETIAWLEDPSPYAVRLYDTQGQFVQPQAVLRDVRRRDEDRRDLGLIKARKVISRAFTTCDQLSLEPEDFKTLVHELLEEHYNA